MGNTASQITLLYLKRFNQINLRFSFFCVFILSKGRRLDFYCIASIVISLPGNGRQAVAKLGVKNFQAWNDEQLPVYDCLEKLRGYKYMAVVDFDEYIIPEKDDNWMTLFVS